VRDELAEATAIAAKGDASAHSLASAIAAAAAAGEGLSQLLGALRAEASAGAETAAAAVERLSVQQRQLGEVSEAAMQQLATALDEVEARATQTHARLAAETGAIEASARIALAETERATVVLGEAVAGHAATLAAAASSARQTLDQLGSDAAQQVQRRLEALASAAGEIEGRLRSQLTTTDAIGGTAERAFQLLDARLQHSASTSAQTLESLSARVQDVHDRVDSLADPIRTARQALGELQAGAGALQETADSALGALEERLPPAAEALCARNIELQQQLAAVEAALQRATEGAAALGPPIRESQAAFDAAAAGFDRQRESVKIAGEALVVELEQARQLIAEVEAATEATSLAAATRLVDAMTRVRDVAQQTTGTLRQMLAGVIGEARESLATAAGSAMQASFAEPIAAQAEEASRAAQAAAERAAASMAALASTIRLVEARAEASRADLEEAAQRELAAASAFLTDRLAAASVSIASALGQPMTDEDWARWRKGERTLFRRRAITLLDKAEAPRLKALVAQNRDFADAARAYAAGFDALLARFDRAGAPGIASALLDSDSGRLAAALAEVLED
jgi:hypothetical protein